MNYCSVKMPKRKDTVNSSKIQSYGIFTGARVVRGPDWDWGNQDGMLFIHHPEFDLKDLKLIFETPMSNS